MAILLWMIPDMNNVFRPRAYSITTQKQKLGETTTNGKIEIRESKEVLGPHLESGP
jgi:hypothetical protein